MDKENEFLHWYELCTGDVISSKQLLTYAEMACVWCGDSAMYIGEFKTEDEANKELDVILYG